MSVIARLNAARKTAEDLRSAGRPAAARDLLDAAVEAVVDEGGREHPSTLETMRLLAVLHHELGELPAARRRLEQALTAGHHGLGDAHPLMLTMSAQLGAVAVELNNRYEARRNFERVARLGPDVLGDEHPAVVAARRYLAAGMDVVPAPPTTPGTPPTAAGTPPTAAGTAPTEPAGAATTAGTAPAEPAGTSSATGPAATPPGAAPPPTAVIPASANTPPPTAATSPSPDAVPAGSPGTAGDAGSEQVRVTRIPGPRVPVEPVPTGWSVPRPDAAGRPDGTPHPQVAPPPQAPPEPDPSRRPDPSPRPGGTAEPDESTGPEGTARAPDEHRPRHAAGPDRPGTAGPVATGSAPASRTGGAPGRHAAPLRTPQPPAFGTGDPLWNGDTPDEPLWSLDEDPDRPPDARDGSAGRRYPRRRQIIIALLTVVGFAAVATAVGGLLTYLDRSGARGTPVVSTSAGGSAASGAAPGGDATGTVPASPALAPPTGLSLTDQGTAVTLRWVDPSGGRVPFIIAAGHAGENARPFHSVDAGTTTYTVDGLNPGLDYCFTVVAVYGTNQFGTSNLLCTSRRTSPGPSGTNR